MTTGTQASRILVPTDFSAVAACAAAHAATIAAKAGDEVWLMHVINKESRAGLKKRNAGIETLHIKLQEQCGAYTQQYKVVFNYMLKEGSIFTTISEAATEINANLMVLGTHGVQGVQHIIGAYALKVVGSSRVPVIIVQQKEPRQSTYHHIVSPIDASTQTKQKTLQTISIAKTFGARVFLFRQKYADDYLDDLTKLNLNFVLRYLNDHQVDAEVVEQATVKGDFAKDFISYSKQIKADLIIILTTAEKGLKDIILGPVEQDVINNPEQIPVMCVNPLRHLYRTERLAAVTLAP